MREVQKPIQSSVKPAIEIPLPPELEWITPKGKKVLDTIASIFARHILEQANQLKSVDPDWQEMQTGIFLD